MTGSGVLPRFRFPRSARLLKAADFQKVFARPRRSSDAYFTVLAILSDGRTARLGLAIAKKQVRLATQRNRLKRLAREAFRLQRMQLGSIDLVVMARASAANADSRELAHSLQGHLQRLSSTGDR